MQKIISLAISDFKLIFRDPSLKAFLLLPVLLFAFVLIGIPLLVDKFPILAPYVSIFLMVGIIENTQIFSFIGTMVLIDEKETKVSQVYGVVPITKFEFIISRFIIPFTITVVLNLILLYVQPFFDISWLENIAISTLAAMTIIPFVLFINAFADNRLKGMVFIKAFNMLVLIPLAGFFLPDKFQSFFGILPTYWIFECVEKMSLDMDFGWTWVIGIIYMVIIIVIGARLFLKSHFK